MKKRLKGLLALCLALCLVLGMTTGIASAKMSKDGVELSPGIILDAGTTVTAGG